uniref:Uncharacterized protein n=1 Tax=Anguilla anguilla TaxID=7936 RepID=A0A0E9V018_ANGAN
MTGHLAGLSGSAESLSCTPKPGPLLFLGCRPTPEINL